MVVGEARAPQPIVRGRDGSREDHVGLSALNVEVAFLVAVPEGGRGGCLREDNGCGNSGQESSASHTKYYPRPFDLVWIVRPLLLWDLLLFRRCFRF